MKVKINKINFKIYRFLHLKVKIQSKKLIKNNKVQVLKLQIEEQKKKRINKMQLMKY